MTEPMSYLEVASDLFGWLSAYQVRQDAIQAERIGDGIAFTLLHPVMGELAVSQRMPDSNLFRCRGIGLRVEESNAKSITLKAYDDGGIFDPLDDRVPGVHYSATHYALLGAVLYSATGDMDKLEPIERAAAFHVRTSPEEYPLDDWGYHWDFQNYAFIETYRLIGQELPEDVDAAWVQAIRSWKTNKTNYLCNWAAMRAYAALLRGETFGRWLDRRQYRRWIRVVLRTRQPDGCFDDDYFRSRPIQYHAFTLAMIHRMLRVRFDETLARHFLSGVSYLVRFIDPDGCYNTIGRGQEQIFGYAAAVYVLEAARRLDRANADLYGEYARSVYRHLLQFRRDDGHFPLVLNRKLDEERYGWYDYHHLSVYNAFLGAWLGLTHLLCGEEPLSDAGDRLPSIAGLTHFKSTDQVVFSNDGYTVCVGAGLPDYLTEPGITPTHLWFRDIGWVYSCPGGPSSGHFGKLNRVEDVEKNFFAPIALGPDGWFIPCWRTGSVLDVGVDSATLFYDYGGFELTRIIRFEDERIVFDDRLRFSKRTHLDELRLINFPVVIDKFKIDLDHRNEIRLLAPNGAVRLVLEECRPAADRFELGERIKTAKGLAQVVMLRSVDYVGNKGQDACVRYSLQAVARDAPRPQDQAG